jgi:hypothetical protein
MMVIGPSETLKPTHQTTRRHFSWNNNFNNIHGREGPKPHMRYILLLWSLLMKCLSFDRTLHVVVTGVTKRAITRLIEAFVPNFLTAAPWSLVRFVDSCNDGLNLDPLCFFLVQAPLICTENTRGQLINPSYDVASGARLRSCPSEEKNVLRQCSQHLPQDNGHSCLDSKRVLSTYHETILLVLTYSRDAGAPIMSSACGRRDDFFPSQSSKEICLRTYVKTI